MNPIEVDPWLKKNKNATQAYRVDGPLFTIPYVFFHDLTLTKSKDKYFEECRRLPAKFSPVFDEKANPLPHKPHRLEVPIDLKQNEKTKVYMKESSSQHMTTILDGIDESTVKFDNSDFLVTAETLNKIAGSVANQEISWRLRAFVEEYQGRRIIVICDDDLDGSEMPQINNFYIERLESAQFSQELCQQTVGNVPNPFLHGCLAVQSRLSHNSDTVNMIVLGEVDLVAEGNPAISLVMTGIGRSDRADFGDAELNRSKEYIWSRSFWLGLGTCILGLRKEDDGDVEVVQRFSLTPFYSQHRCRNDKEADVATSCVARVLLELRNAVLSKANSNWIVEYEGRDADVEPDNIKIYGALDSFSFWLAREKFHLQKLEEIYKKVKTEGSERKERKFRQKTGLRIRKKSGSIARQFRKYISIQ